MDLIVKPLSRKEAEVLCLKHTHARSLPKSGKYYFGAFINGKVVGLAAWGWGIVPRGTPNKLFGIKDPYIYLELNRFFMIPGTPKYSESKFLNITAKILFNNLPKLKFLFTYAAGFQGMTGVIYKAAGWHYIGKQKMQGYHLIPGVGLVHDIAVYHRYGTKGGTLKTLKRHYPDAVTLYGYNFCYMKFRDTKTQEEMMNIAKFEILKEYPTAAEIRVWDSEGKEYSIHEARQLGAVSLSSKGSKTNKPK